jgi:glutathione S-transferase
MMKLFYSPTSPYSRKARLAVRFKELDDRVEQIACNPFTDAAEQSHRNPLGKVPTLILDNGIVIFDSPVICEYLDGLSPVTTLYPRQQTDWIKVKTTEALGDGILDAAYNTVRERQRIASEQSPSTLAQWKMEIERSLAHAENIIASLDERISQAHISMYCSLCYLDFRLPELGWRKHYPGIMPAWLENFEHKYPFTLDSQPHDPGTSPVQSPTK